MRRNVQVVLLCEDAQSASFARRFLEEQGWSKRQLRVVPFAVGGSGEQFVREQYPVELDAYRSNSCRVGQALVVMTDGDKLGLAARMKALEDECAARRINPRAKDERVAVIVPTWNIETWFAYLDGENVDEHRKDYPRLARERDCRRHVVELCKMCREAHLRDPAPPSLAMACEEYKTRLAVAAR